LPTYNSSRHPVPRVRPLPEALRIDRSTHLRHPRSPAVAYAAKVGLDERHWEGVRLHVVTGKGGTGKTTVSAALALALAAGGRKVLLVEVEERQGLAQLFDVPPLPYAERKLAVAPAGGDVYGLAVDAHEAMHEYLEMYYHLGRAGRALDRMGVVDFATTVAPGLRDVLLTGKTYEVTRRRTASGGPVYAVTSLARVGPVNKHARVTMDLIRSPETAVHVVTLLEEMPVQETLDAIDELRDTEIPVGAVIVNQVREHYLGSRELVAARRGRLDLDAVRDGLTAAGLVATEAAVERLVADAAEHAERVALEAEQRALIDKAGRPVYQLPRIAAGVDLTALYELAEALADQGAA
jgi:anion-transporting  ArsA/GET3 family ATPase